MNRQWHRVVVLSALCSLAATSTQGPEVSRIMREKLGHSQKILEAVVTSQAAETLHEAAARRELEAAPLAYVSLTLACVQCHRYLARERIAK